MCRNIRTLFNFEPVVSEEEIRAASLQFVRKISGFHTPSKANETPFEAAVDDVSSIASRLLHRWKQRARRRIERKRPQKQRPAPRCGSPIKCALRATLKERFGQVQVSRKLMNDTANAEADALHHILTSPMLSRRSGSLYWGNAGSATRLSAAGLWPGPVQFSVAAARVC